MYAIIEDSGTQIKVAEGDVLDLNTRELEEGAKQLVLDKVLAIGDPASDSPAQIGVPYLSGASVTAEILGEIKGEKLHIVKFKRRKGYHRKTGHRQPYLRVKITGISH